MNNNIFEQCASLTRGHRELIENIRRSVGNMFTAADFENCVEIVVAGSGDSNIVGKAMKLFYDEICPGGRFKIRPAPCIDLARSIDFSAVDKEKTVFLIISSGGGSSRVQESAMRIAHYGGKSILLTNNPSGKAAAYAQKVFFADMLERIPGPGLRNYHVNLIAAYAMAMRLGRLFDQLSEQKEDAIYQSMVDLMDAYSHELPEINDRILEIAEKWKNIDAFVGIGDDIDACTMEFAGAKFAECAGLTCPVTDTEDWNHINKHEWEPDRIANLIMAKMSGPNRESIRAMIARSLQYRHPTLIFTDNASEFSALKDKSDICEILPIPVVQGGCRCVSAIADFIPAALLASDLAILNHESFFRGENSIHKTSPIRNTVGTSKIVIV